MYLPKHFRLDDPDQQLALMRRHSFAAVAAPADGGIEVAHIPLLVDRVDGRFLIHGHIARGNKLEGVARATAIFAGPHSYISSAWYEEPDTVPTWNFLAVHAS